MTVNRRENVMKMSCVELERIMAMTPREKWELICGGAEDRGESCEYALLLGGQPDRARERALLASELYANGRICYIVSSGGVTWDNNGEELSECDLMTRILMEAHVPMEAIIPENEALTTRENMIYGTLRLNRKTKFADVDRIMIITSVWHMKRSLALAKCFLPRKVSACGCPVLLTKPVDEWLGSEANMALIDNEIRLLKVLVDHGIIEDIEVKIN